MNERTERQLAAWLMEGPDRGPTEGLERVLALTRQTRQRPSWTFPERWIPMQLAIPRTAFVIPRGAVLLVVAVLLLLATLWIAGVGRSPRLPAPIGLAGNGLLAIDGGGRITVLSTDGSVKRVVTSEDETALFPVWSPDGTHLAYFAWPGSPPTDTNSDPIGNKPLQRSGMVVVTDANGGDRTVVMDRVQFAVDYLASTVSWSHDSKRIAFSFIADNGRPTIAVRSPAGAVIATIAGGDTPTWSPDDTRLAFRGMNSGVYVVPIADPSQIRRVSSASGSGFAFSEPQWSPDGNRLLFYAGDDNAHDIWVVNADGTGERAISTNPVDEYWPVWSPDGKRLAFQRVVNDRNEANFVLAGANGAGQVTVPTAPLAAMLAPWSPDGRYLVGAEINADDTAVESLVLIDTRTNKASGRIAANALGPMSWQRVAP